MASVPSGGARPEVTVVIVNYKVAELARQAVASILTDPDRPRLEIILVDNSEDEAEADKLEEIARGEEGIELLVSPVNLGFAGGVNAGLTRAGGRFIALLNPDARVAPSWLAGPLRLLDASPDMGLVSPLTNRVGHYGGLRSIDSEDSHTVMERGRKIARALNGLHLEMPLLGFFCVIGRREVFARTGPLDEQYQTGGFEDDDYCRRIRKHGLRLALALDSFVLHHHARSFLQLPFSRREEIHASNRKLFEAKWGKPDDAFSLRNLAAYLEALAQLGVASPEKPTRDVLGILRDSALAAAAAELPRVLEGENEPAPEACRQYVRRIDDLEKTISKWQIYIDSLEFELNSRRKSMSEWEKYIISLEEEVKARRRTMSEWEAHIDSLKKEIETRRKTMSAWEAHIDSLGKEIEARRKTMSEWEIYIASLEEAMGKKTS
jgi:GT2 family glycosyltransferase/uncharacterized coiled-coil protein SlyX